MSKKELKKILQDTEFQHLVKTVTKTSLIFTATIMIIYYFFILLLAYGKEFLAQPISKGSATTIGIPIGIGVIVAAWILTGLYVFWANKNYDPMVKKLRERFRG